MKKIIVIITLITICLLSACSHGIILAEPSDSMEPTIKTGQKVKFSNIKPSTGLSRGDIIAFAYPDDPKQTFIKRIIGTPGDKVVIIDGITYVNGEELDEPYLYEKPVENDFGPYDVPENSYFVMGDNRNHFRDSRYWKNNYVKKDAIKGVLNEVVGMETTYKTW